MYRCIFVLLGLGVLANAQIVPPHVGFLHTDDGQVRPVTGLPASFVLGGALHEAAVSVSFSDRAGVVLQADRICILDSQGAIIATDGVGDAGGIAAISGGADTAIAWLPAIRTLLWFDGSSFEQRELTGDLPGSVISLRRDGSDALLLLDEGKTVSEARVSLSSGNLVSATLLPDVTAPAIYFGTQVVTAQQLHLPCAATRIEPMSDGWLHCFCKGAADRAVQFHAGEERVSELPIAHAASRVQQIGPHEEAKQ